MDMVARLPTMADAALKTLRSNAERLGQSGTPAQQSAALALIPAIEAELSSRRAAGPARAKVVAGAKPKARTGRKVASAKPKKVSSPTDERQVD